MTSKGKVNFNNGKSVVKKYESETPSCEFAILQMSESGTGEVTITDENIATTSEFICDMCDDTN